MKQSFRFCLQFSRNFFSIDFFHHFATVTSFSILLFLFVNQTHGRSKQRNLALAYFLISVFTFSFYVAGESALLLLHVGILRGLIHRHHPFLLIARVLIPTVFLVMNSSLHSFCAQSCDRSLTHLHHCLGQPNRRMFSELYLSDYLFWSISHNQVILDVSHRDYWLKYPQSNM